LKDKIKEGYKYDGIIIDSTDMDYEDSASLSLFTVEFYKNIQQVLKKNGSFSQ